MEVTGAHEAIDLDDASAIGEVRRRAQAIAAELGLDVARANDAGLVATEAASNVLKHAGHGGALLAPLTLGGARGVSITVWDRGPGMDVERCLRDGMSTAGTAGAGLGAIARLATRWDAYARAGQGTVLTASILPRGTPAPRLDLGGVSVPITGEVECGDGWDAYVDDAGVALIVIDGLGHGPAAAQAAAAVIGAFRHRPVDAPSELLARGDRAARATRGAAATAVRYDRATRAVTIAGVGNVAAFLLGGARLRPLVVQHGTLGQAVPTLREERYPMPDDGLVVVCSDGLRSRITFDDHPGLEARAAATIAAVLWRDFGRGRDDATVVVLRPEPRR